MTLDLKQLGSKIPKRVTGEEGDRVSFCLRPKWATVKSLTFTMRLGGATRRVEIRGGVEQVMHLEDSPPRGPAPSPGGRE